MFRKTLILMTLLVLIGCAVDHTGLAPTDRLEFRATPDILCLGDSTSLRWRTLSVPYSSDYCAASSASYGAPRRCNITADCPSGVDVNCVDGMCLGPEDDPQELDFGDGCPLDTLLSIDAISMDGGMSEQVGLESDRLNGRQQHTPAESTLYAARYRVSGDSGTAGSALVTVIDPGSEIARVLEFGAPSCTQATQALNLRLGEYGVFDPSVSVSLDSVRNRSAAAIMLGSTNPSIGPVRLGAGETTTLFNGTVPRNWRAQLDPSGPFIPLPADCTVAGGYTPIPIEVLVRLSCN